ncbi:MAG: thioredoxin family protein [bacterium]|nr:thioredoxin family protein [bacterium]
MYLKKWVCPCLIIFFGFGCNHTTTPKEEIKQQIDSAIQEEIIQKGDVQESPTLPPAKIIPQIEVEKKEGIKEHPEQEEIHSLQQKPMEIEAKEIRWYSSFEEGLKIGKEEGKPLMVDFEASWCDWCKKLDKTTYKDTQVIILAKKFIPVKVDCDTDRVTPQKYGIRGLPTIIFMDSAGQILHQITSYRGPEDFVAEMEKVINEN